MQPAKSTGDGGSDPCAAALVRERMRAGAPSTRSAELRNADNDGVEYLDERDLNIYIDGSSLSAPRRGGVGIVFITEGPDGHWVEQPYDVFGFAAATNNQMELQAAIEALQALGRGRAPVQASNY